MKAVSVDTGTIRSASVIPPTSETASSISGTAITAAEFYGETIREAELPTGGTIVKKGYSPYVDLETGTWWEYDDVQKAFINTGIEPQGPKGESAIIAGNGISYDEETNILSVVTVDDAIEDNSLPISSGAVYREIGNIDILLQII